MRGLMCFVYIYICVCGSDNKIGVEGGSVIGAALATNSTLTKLSLRCECGNGLCDVGCVECVKEEG